MTTALEAARQIVMQAIHNCIATEDYSDKSFRYMIEYNTDIWLEDEELPSDPDAGDVIRAIHEVLQEPAMTSNPPTEPVADEAPATATPAGPGAGSLRPRYVVRRDGRLEPMNGATTRAEADTRIDREITTGQVQEVDLYVYLGTFKPKRVVEVFDAFKDKSETEDA
jgi:hypothetical protein